MGGTWDNVKDEYNHPVERTAHAAALMQAKAEPYCRMTTFIVTQTYTNGSYATPHAGSFHPEFQVSACK